MTTTGYGDIYPKQRFLAADVQAIEAEVAIESGSVDLILVELRAVRERLGELESHVQRIGES